MHSVTRTSPCTTRNSATLPQPDRALSTNAVDQSSRDAPPVMATPITSRAERSLRLTAYQASLHATGEQEARLRALLDAHTAGHITTRDARAAVIALRCQQQQEHRAA